MEEFVLYLLPFKREELKLNLYPYNSEPIAAENAHLIDAKVFGNITYSGKLKTEQPHNVHHFQLLVNDSFVETMYNSIDGTFQIVGKPFMEFYGYVKLTVKFYYDGNYYALDTDYMSVMMRKNELQNKSVQRIAAYVYKYNDLITDNKSMINKNRFNLKNSNQKSIESRLILLRKISHTLTSNYAYFKTNSRFKTVQSERVDQFEKLQHFSANTIKFIAQHPDQLHKSSFSAGVRIGKYNYQPDKTLINNNVTSYDTIENHAIVDFIYTLYTEILNMSAEIKKLMANIPKTPEDIDSYISSKFFMYSIITDNFNKNTLSDLLQLENQYAALLSSYYGIYNFKGKRISSPPRPTIVFLSVPNYKQIYDCIAEWFDLGAFNLDEEKYMLSFMKIGTLYEMYVLLKLINYLKDSRYKFTKGSNVYTFSADNTKVSIYYQPKIYNGERNDYRIHNIGLYRNNTLKFPTPDMPYDYISGGDYYKPDYVIKIETLDSNEAKYIIIDAKFSTVETIKKYEIAELVFKYLFSLSPINISDKITGLYIINGQSDKEIDEVTPVYDKEINEISPNAAVITLTENSTNNINGHIKLLRATIGKHLST